MEASSLLQGKDDFFGGFIVDETNLPEDPSIFGASLEASLKSWNQNGKHGFVFHHAQPSYVTLTKWLPKEKSTLPQYATHLVGVGGFVVNDRNEILTVTEKNGPIKGFWKIPGGMVEPGEEICDGAIREVLEETGIKCEFVSLLCFRQATSYAFPPLADLYFVCKLKPLNLNITKQESEIQDCKWMPAEEFFRLPYGKGLYKKVLDIQKESTETYDGWKAETLPIGFRPGTNLLYHGTSRFQDTGLPKL